MRVLLLNGPNLNLLGTRRPDVYGSTTLVELESMFAAWADELGIDEVGAFQSNHEGALIDRLHAARGHVDGVVFNPGAFTHSSYALHDAIEAVEIPTVEVHISNVEEREEWRRRSVVRPACVYTIYGRGTDGYRWGLRHLVARSRRPVETIRYGPANSQRGDLRLPVSPGPHPLVVLIHGGFWRHMWTADTTELIADDLTARGLATFNIEYRRVGDGGGGTRTVDDVIAAIEAVLRHPDVDAGRWAVLGHSAGGQLALLGAKHFAGRGQSPRLVVPMGAVTDLRMAISNSIGAGAAAEFVGDEPVAALSPVESVPIGASILVAHGVDDDRVPVTQGEAFVNSARSAGDTVDTFLEDGIGHFDFLEPNRHAWTTVAAAIGEALIS